MEKNVKKSAVLFSVFAVTLLARACFHTLPASAAAPALYVVSVDIAATTGEPGFLYEKGDGFIEYEESLKKVLLYGNIVEAAPLTEGGFAGRWGEVSVYANDDATLKAMEENEIGKNFGYVDMANLAPLPDVAFFPEAEPVRFMTDSPELFLLPGSLSLADYTRPNAKPYYVLAGEVVDGVGEFKDASGRDWTLLRFGNPGWDGLSLRYAWARSSDVMRLARREPDYAKVDPALIPRNIRGFGRVEDKFYDAMTKHGFALDAAPVLHKNLRVDDLVDSYPGGDFGETTDGGDETRFVPNFVTTDLFLHAFHLVFSRGLKDIENVSFAPALGTMLKGALTKLDALEKGAGENDFVKSSFARAGDFLTVPAALLAEPDKISEMKPSRAAREEIGKILRAEGISASAISGKDEDYTFYLPRGHYAGSEELSRYFRAMAYLGGMPALLDPERPGSEGNRRNTALIAILCALFEDAGLKKSWDSVYEPLTWLTGAVDDPSVNEHGPVVKKVLGGDLTKLADVKTLDTLTNELIAATPAPKIIDRAGSEAGLPREKRAAESSGFRLMGRRFVLDAWMFGRLTSPNVGSDENPRNLPKAEDVMAVLGSSVADASLESDKRGVPKYADALAKVKAESETYLKGSENVVTDWLNMLSLVLTEKGSKQFFMNAPLWEAKKLLTASASWAELKHDTVLYAKQNYAEMGGGDEWVVVPFDRPEPRGYVEPSPLAFGAMADTLSRLAKIADKYSLGIREYEEGLGMIDVQAKAEALREAALIFRDIAEKEAKEESLSMEDYQAIAGITNYLNANLLLDSSYIEEDDADQLKMALVSDVATDAQAGRVLHVATGTPRRLYVFVDDKGSGPRVTVGYTYSFYEFERALEDGRMTDEEWKKLVYDETRREKLEKLTPKWAEGLFVR
jgi:hypothetical protein